MAPTIPYPNAQRPAPAPELLKQIAVFRFCEDELHLRAAHSAQPWVWEMKGKVAAFCRGSLERHLPEDEPTADCTLTDREERELLQTHPLLSAPVPASTTTTPAPDWLLTMRRRVADFLGSVRKSRDMTETE
jgi:hypothetical protein